MLLNEKQEYINLMMGLFEEYNASLKDSVLNNWFNELADTPLSDFRQAVSGYIRNEKFPPRLSSIISYLPNQVDLCAEEAWDHVPKSERDSGYVTARMMQALGVAEEMITRNDWIGAKLAFTRTYDTLPADTEFYYSQAYGVDYEDKEQRKIDDYKLLENKKWIKQENLLRLKPRALLMIENGSGKMLTESEKQRGKESVSTILEMLNSSQKNTGGDYEMD